MGRIFSIMSGKGGVGKSTLAAALAEYYARQGKQVILLDGDIGLRCADLMLGMQDRVMYDLGDVAEKNCELDQALIQHGALPTLFLMAAPQMMLVSDIKGKRIGRIIDALGEKAEIVLLDAPAGMGKGLKNLLGTTATPVIVATPDDVCLRDAERLAGYLAQMEEPRPGIVFNRVREKLVRRGEMKTPEAMARMLDLELMGAVPESEKLYRALLRGESPLMCGDKGVFKAVEVIAARLLGADAPLKQYRSSPILQFFSRRGEA